MRKEDKPLAAGVAPAYEYGVNSIGQRETLACSGSTPGAAANRTEWGYDGFGQVASDDDANTAVGTHTMSTDNNWSANNLNHLTEAAAKEGFGIAPLIAGSQRPACQSKPK